MVGTLTRESLVLVNENTTHLPPLHVRGTRVRFYGKRKRGRGCNKRVEEEEVKEEEKENKWSESTCKLLLPFSLCLVRIPHKR